MLLAGLGAARAGQEAIAEALEDPAVLAAIRASGGIYFAMVVWADAARVAVEWRRVASPAAAGLVRRVPRQPGDFTCLGGMMRMVAARVVPSLPVPADRTVVGGPGAFLMAARGYGDFARALRQKFVAEISGLDTGDGHASLASR